jgi:hypothetical protein
MNRTRELTRLDSSELLPHFRGPLDTEDVDTLVEGPTVARQYWISEVEAALAATTIHQKFKRNVNANSTPLPHNTVPRIHAIINNKPLSHSTSL